MSILLRPLFCSRGHVYMYCAVAVDKDYIEWIRNTWLSRQVDPTH